MYYFKKLKHYETSQNETESFNRMTVVILINNTCANERQSIRISPTKRNAKKTYLGHGRFSNDGMKAIKLCTEIVILTRDD
jgi:hypothetical protein